MLSNFEIINNIDNMKTFYKILIGLAVVVAVGTGLWLNRQYGEIKTAVYMQQEADITKYINDQAITFGLAPAFIEKDPVRQQQIFEEFYGVIQTPELFRLKVFDLTPKIVWANLAALIGEDASTNKDVRNAINGTSGMGFKSKPGDVKVERLTERQFTDFTETYLPVKDASGKVVGVVEAYQTVFGPEQQIKDDFGQSATKTIVIVLLAYLVAAIVLRFSLKTS